MHDEVSGAVLFGTTSYFLERMGLRTLDELPPLAPHLPEVDELEAELGRLAEAAATSARTDPEPEKRATDPFPSHSSDRTEAGVRLQKVLAAAGIGSRRACEQLDQRGSGRGERTVVLEQGLRVDPERDTIRVDGSRIPPPRRHVYLVLNKPKRRRLDPMEDPEGRRTIADLPDTRQLRDERLFHVGRLDTDTEGLMIMTNDGDFAQTAGASLVRGAEDLSRRGRGRAERADTEAAARRRRPLEDGPVQPNRGSSSSPVPGTRPSSRSRCTRAGTGSCAVRWTRSGTRSASLSRTANRAGPARPPEVGRAARADPRGTGRVAGPDRALTWRTRLAAHVEEGSGSADLRTGDRVRRRLHLGRRATADPGRGGALSVPPGGHLGP